MRPELVDGEVVDAHAAHVNGDTGLEGNEPALMDVECLIADEEVDIVRGSDVTVGADRQPAGEGVWNSEALELPVGGDRCLANGRRLKIDRVP